MQHPTQTRRVVSALAAAPLLAGLLGCAGGGGGASGSPRIDGRAIVALADGDMKVTMFSDGQLFGGVSAQVARAPDYLTVVGLPLPGEGRAQVGFAQVSNSSIGPPMSLAVSRDGSFALVLATRGRASDDAQTFQDLSPGGRLTLVDLREPFSEYGPRALDSIDLGRAVSSVSLHPSGRFALVLDREAREVIVVRVENSRLVPDARLALVGMSGGAEPTSALISPSGDGLAVCTVGADAVYFYEIAQNDGALGLRRWGEAVEVGVFPYTGRWTPDSRHFVTTDLGWDRGSDDYLRTAPRTQVSLIRVADMSSDDGAHKVVGSVQAGQNGEGIAVSPRGDLVAIGNLRRSFLPDTDPDYTLGGSITLLAFDAETGEIRVVDEQEGPTAPQGLAFDRSGRHLLVAGYDEGIVQVWRVRRENGGDPSLEFTGVRVGVGDGAHMVEVLP